MYCLQELIGPNWTRLSKFISTKSASQIKRYHRDWSETANVIQDCMDDFSESYVMVPSSPAGLDMLEDPLGILQTATTTITTTPMHSIPDSTAPMGLGNSFTITCAQKSSQVNDLSPSSASVLLYGSNNVTDQMYSTESDHIITSANNCQISQSLGYDSVTYYDADDTCDRGSRDPIISGFDHWDIANHVSIADDSSVVTMSSKSDVVLSNTSSTIKNSSKRRDYSTSKRNEESKCKRSDRGSSNHSKKSQSKTTDFNPSPVKDSMQDDHALSLHSELEGQIVRLCKYNSDEDDNSEVDIDISDSESCNGDVSSSSSSITAHKSQLHDGGHGGIFSEEKHLEFTFPPPEQEVFLSTSEVTDEEKKIHFEYFENRGGVKTTERYLKIRNSIIDIWRQNKPTYLGKTTARKNLKNCGDVNSIGKVYEFLEKKGVINFGCSSSKYDSPLIISTRKRNNSNSRRLKVDRSNVARFKQNKFRIGLSEGGGLTIRHDSSGAVIDACHVSETPKSRSSSAKSAAHHNDQFKLIQCCEYEHGSHDAPFDVTLHPQALVSMDLHSHSSIAEVMGLVGGYYDTSNSSVHVTVAVPTRATSSGVECDMCPVSQSEACIKIQECGVHVVGWYHSHPNFPPKPSLQDIESQSAMQKWFARRESPFLGIIVSPFCPTNRTEKSQIQCLILDNKPDNDPLLKQPKIPYRLVWKISEEIPSELMDLSKEIRSVVNGRTREFNFRTDWRKEWKPKLTYWEKAIRSLELLLPSAMGDFVQLVKQAFIVAIKEQMEDR